MPPYISTTEWNRQFVAFLYEADDELDWDMPILAFISYIRQRRSRFHWNFNFKHNFLDHLSGDSAITELRAMDIHTGYQMVVHQFDDWLKANRGK